MEIAKLASLSLDQFIWAMIIRLNLRHSLGGVSSGRSIRSTYLEIALAYNRYYRVLEGLDTDPLLEIDSKIYIDASKERTAQEEELMLFPHLTPEQATDRQLVELAMHEMGKWYDKDQERRDALPFTEYELAKAISRLLRPCFMPIYRFPENRIEELYWAWHEREYQFRARTSFPAPYCII
jgi:hypothetical protein